MNAAAERLLDEAMPRWDVHERHQRVVAAPLEDVWRAVLDLTVGELPLTSALMRVRTLGAPLGARDRPVVDALPPGEVDRREPTELLYAMVSPTSWRKPMSSGPATQPGTTEQLNRPLPDGWVRVGMDFRLQPVAAGTTRLATETRVLATGPRAKRVFGVYWLVIRAGSGAIRREMLRAVARRAEAASV
jgi:hypothetical protein